MRASTSRKVPVGLHPTRSATLSLGKDVVGVVGEVHPDVLDAYGISERVAVLELNLSVLLAAEPKVPQWKPTSRFPSSDFDLAFAVPESVAAEKVEKAIRQGAGGGLVDLALFDVYRGHGHGRGHPQPGLPPAAAGRRPHAHRRRRGRRCATRSSPAVAKLGAAAARLTPSVAC